MALICATKQHVTKLERERGRYSGKERGKKTGINVKMLNGLFSSCGKMDRGVL